MATERTLTEAEKQALVPGIEFVSNPAGRRPRLVGDIEIWEIIDTYHQCDDDRDAIRQVFPHLTEQQVDTALAYYKLFADEIDRWIEDNYAWTPDDIEAFNRGIEALIAAKRDGTAATPRAPARKR